ncbi:MAG: SPOR domain-containing protein [Gammaproteobacteria bacterium]|nr:SPOR domain-containing protein [Gammaproteobacteria bacterium]
MAKKITFPVKDATPPSRLKWFAFGLIVGLLMALTTAFYLSEDRLPFVDKDPNRTHNIRLNSPPKDVNNFLSDKKSPHEPPNTTPSEKNVADEEPSKNSADSADLESPTQTTVDSKTESRKDQFLYFVQVLSSPTEDDLQSIRAKMILEGFSPQISSNDASGKLVYRLRIGPYESLTEAQTNVDKLKSAKFSGLSLIKVRRS